MQIIIIIMNLMKPAKKLQSTNVNKKIDDKVDRNHWSQQTNKMVIVNWNS